MRTLQSALTTAYGGPVQRPAWFVEITLNGSTEYRSSYSTVTWNSHSWTQTDIDVGQLRVGALEVDGEISFGNADDYFGGLALGEGFTDKRFRIWGFDGSIASPGVSDPVLVCTAVGGGSRFAGMNEVVVSLRHKCAYQVSPIKTVSPQWGFSVMLPEGRTFAINGQTYVIERGRTSYGV